MNENDYKQEIQELREELQKNKEAYSRLRELTIMLQMKLNKQMKNNT